MKQTKAEKLYYLLKEICSSEENMLRYRGLAGNVPILSVLLYMENGEYKGIHELLNPKEIKTFSIINQKENKMINILAKDVKSSSYRDGVFRINRHSTIVNETKHFVAKKKKREEIEENW